VLCYRLTCCIYTTKTCICLDITLRNVVKVFNLVINQLDAQNFCFTIRLFHASTCFEHRVLVIGRSELYYTASSIITPIGGCPVHGTTAYRCDDTRGCIIQFWPPDDEHKRSKHEEAWNKLIVKQKFCASNWLITETNLLKQLIMYVLNYIHFRCHSQMMAADWWITFEGISYVWMCK